MTEVLWKVLAWVVSRQPVADWLITRAQRTPYFHLTGYMDRWWLFNGYGNDISTPEKQRQEKPISWLPSIRIHHILRADTARDLHDHPWDARTIILRGGYAERRLNDVRLNPRYGRLEFHETNVRRKGDTATINHGEYHSIDRVSEGGVWTMFFTWKYVGTWGFLVNGVKVPHKSYKDGGAA